MWSRSNNNDNSDKYCFFSLNHSFHTYLKCKNLSNIVYCFYYSILLIILIVENMKKGPVELDDCVE